MEGRAPHEPRAGPALRVVPATPRGDLIPSAPSRTLPSSSRRRSLSSLSPTVNINLGRLHLYLMLPISSLILPLPLTSSTRGSVLLSHLRGLHLAFFISRETHHPAESRRVRHGAPQVHPANPAEGEFIVPLVMDSHDAVRHRRPV